ncbi:MAG TPA: hypothetical protein VGK58_06260 [Lacipirellulaceae bacterium]
MRYKKFGKNASWRLRPIDGSAHSLWLPIFVKWDTLENQETQLQRGFDAGTLRNKERVEALFMEYAAATQNPVVVPLPPTVISAPDYVCAICTSRTVPHPTSQMFANDFGKDVIDGWKAEGAIPVSPVQLVRGGHTFTVAAACPPGKLKSGVAIGLPQRRQRAKRPPVSH